MKPRNKLVLNMMHLKPGPHGKTTKAMRRKEKVDMNKILRSEALTVKQSAFNRLIGIRAPTLRPLVKCILVKSYTQRFNHTN